MIAAITAALMIVVATMVVTFAPQSAARASIPGWSLSIGTAVTLLVATSAALGWVSVTYVLTQLGGLEPMRLTTLMAICLMLMFVPVLAGNARRDNARTSYFTGTAGGFLANINRPAAPSSVQTASFNAATHAVMNRLGNALFRCLFGGTRVAPC